MKATILSAAFMLLALLAATPAGAIPRTFVSGTGAGAACTRAAPCATFQAAHDAADQGGEVNCLRSGSFGGFTVTKSITIDCAGAVAATDGNININTNGVTVRLRNLTLSSGNVGGSAVSFFHGTALFVEKCTVTHLSAGIFFANSSGASRLFVSDTLFVAENNGAISVSSNGTSVHATIDGVRIDKNGLGGVSAISQTGVASVHVRNSEISRAGVGIESETTATGLTSVTVDRSSLRLGSTGVFASGSNSFVVLGRSTVMSNQTGLAANGGHVVSYQNNHLTGNVTDGAPTSVVTVH
jgi:hypothetical protein